MNIVEIIEQAVGHPITDRPILIHGATYQGKTALWNEILTCMTEPCIVNSFDITPNLLVKDFMHKIKRPVNRGEFTFVPYRNGIDPAEKTKGNVYFCVNKFILGLMSKNVEGKKYLFLDMPLHYFHTYNQINQLLLDVLADLTVKLYDLIPVITCQIPVMNGVISADVFPVNEKYFNIGIRIVNDCTAGENNKTAIITLPQYDNMEIKFAPFTKEKGLFTLPE